MSVNMSTDPDAASLGESSVIARARPLLAEHPIATTPTAEFLASQFDAGLAWVHFPVGLGGLGLVPAMQSVVNGILFESGAPVPLDVNFIGYGIAGPTILAHGRPDLARRVLKPAFTGREIFCQLFSEPGAGSDLAGLATRAVRDGDDWVVTGQKVWTTFARHARWGLLATRTDPDVPKHAGLTYFVLDMRAPGIEVRPLRQMTGDAEFNEVFLQEVRVPDANRLGDVGGGWTVVMTTLMNERNSVGSTSFARGEGVIADALDLWRSQPDRQTPVLADRLTQLACRAEALRLTQARYAVARGDRPPGPEGSLSKVVAAELNKSIYEFCMDLLGADASTFLSYEADRLEQAKETIQWKFLRSRPNTIEGGTSEIVRNLVGERMLGLPPDIRVDKDIAWRDIPRG